MSDNARYIPNKKCTNKYENEDADQLRGNSVTYQRLCSRFSHDAAHLDSED